MAAEMDLVLIYFENQPLSFARIEKIAPDVKKDWYQVTLLILQMPLQTVTWILRDAYIDGAPFTMGGKQMRLEAVVPPAEVPASGDDDTPSEQPATVISLADLQREK